MRTHAPRSQRPAAGGLQAGGSGRLAEPREPRLPIWRWGALAQCWVLGHRWRQSHSKAGFQTCQRCRLRRMPMS